MENAKIEVSCVEEHGPMGACAKCTAETDNTVYVLRGSTSSFYRNNDVRIATLVKVTPSGQHVVKMSHGTEVRFDKNGNEMGKKYGADRLITEDEYLAIVACSEQDIK